MTERPTSVFMTEYDSLNKSQSLVYTAYLLYFFYIKLRLKGFATLGGFSFYRQIRSMIMNITVFLLKKSISYLFFHL